MLDSFPLKSMELRNALLCHALRLVVSPSNQLGDKKGIMVNIFAKYVVFCSSKTPLTS